MESLIDDKGRHLFTPRQGEKRLRMRLSADDAAKIGRGEEWKARVTDLLTSKTYDVKGADCGLGRCFCDAVIVREVKS